MADQKLRELTEETAPVSTDIMYMVGDPGGTPVDRKVEIGTLLGADGAWVNLAKNSPGQIVTDGAEPQWWDDVANATITDEDAAGEGIIDKSRRVFKVVTTANDVYGYQTYTFADEDLLDAGQTVVSASCWVYCASANKASIGIYGTNLGLQESNQHAGDSAWHLLKVESVTLNAADASIQLRLIVDTGTAFFAMPMLNLGSKVLPWRPRGMRYVSIAQAELLNVTGTDVAWSDLDCTAATHPLATFIQVSLYCAEPNGTLGSYITAGHDNSLVGGDYSVVTARVIVLAGTSSPTVCNDGVMCDDAQTIRYSINEMDADSDLISRIYIVGYMRWE